MPDPLLRIGALAAAAGVTTRTIDHYTRLGLLVPAERSGGNYRLYKPSDVDRIALVRQLETHGVSLDDIAVALSSSGAGLPDALERINRDMAALQLAADSAVPEAHGVLTAITARIQGLINLALHIPPDLFLP